MRERKKEYGWMDGWLKLESERAKRRFNLDLLTWG